MANYVSKFTGDEIDTFIELFINDNFKLQVNVSGVDPNTTVSYQLAGGSGGSTTADNAGTCNIVLSTYGRYTFTGRVNSVTKSDTMLLDRRKIFTLDLSLV